jgi:hypothetical protein
MKEPWTRLTRHPTPKTYELKKVEEGECEKNIWRINRIEKEF